MIVVVVVVTVLVDDVDDGRRDRIIDFGVITCNVGDNGGAGFEVVGDSFFNGENRSKSSRLAKSGSLDTGGIDRRGAGDITGFSITIAADFVTDDTGECVSCFVRLRLAAGV